VWMIENF